MSGSDTEVAEAVQHWLNKLPPPPLTAEQRQAIRLLFDTSDQAVSP